MFDMCDVFVDVFEWFGCYLYIVEMYYGVNFDIIVIDDM